MVHGGTLRSQFGETSEAMYLTQGFVYDSAEAAEARFKGEEDGFIYSRYANPTNEMFEQRMCLLECMGKKLFNILEFGKMFIEEQFLLRIQGHL